MKRINLTQHLATAEQECLEPENKSLVQSLLTFETLPSMDEINDRATALAIIAKQAHADQAMIGGAPFLMSSLETALHRFGITPVYAFSQRVCVEDSVTGTKTSIFKHLGFVEA